MLACEWGPVRVFRNTGGQFEEQTAQWGLDGTAGWWTSVVAADFNGDGKADLAFTTVCHFADSSCSDGDNNSVYVATSTGAGTFTMGSRQDVGPASGWIDYYASVGDFNGDGKCDTGDRDYCDRNSSACSDYETRHCDYNGRLCMSSATGANDRSLGIDRAANPISDMLHADVIFMIGAGQ